MNNPLTDTLKLVQQEEGRGTFHIFRRRRAEKYGFCLVVFRNKAFLGYIPSTDITVEGDILRRYERIGIKDGDAIFSVNLGPQPLEVSDILPTQDGYPREYKLTLDICVIDPIKFAQKYVQETDPVARARTAIEGYIQQCASHWRHDDMNESLLREFAEQALTIEPNTALGLKVLKAQKASLQLNPNRAREIELSQKRKLEEKEIQTEGYLSRAREQEKINLQTLTTQGVLDIEQLKIEAKRRQDEIDGELARQEELKRREHEYRKAVAEREEQLRLQGHTHQLEQLTTKQRFLLEKAQTTQEHEIAEMKLLEQYKQQVRIHEVELADQQHQLDMERRAWESQMQKKWIAEVGSGAIPALVERIKEQLADDKSSLRGAVSEPELQYMLNILAGAGGSSASGNPLLAIAQNKEAITVSESKDDTSAKPGKESKPVQALPGVIQQKEDTIEIPDLGLKLIQTYLSEEQCQRAGIGASSFIIYMIDEYGPAREAQLMVSDIVVELNGEQPTTVQDISNAISSRQTGSAVSLCVLRGEALIEIEVDNPL